MPEDHLSPKLDLHAFENPQDVLMNAPVGIITSTPDGRILSANQTLAHLLGYDTPRELVNSITDVSTQIYDYYQDREKIKQFLELHGQIMNHECRLRRRDGTKLWVSINARTIPLENESRFVFQGFITDISGRKQIEKSLRETYRFQHLLSRANEIMLRSESKEELWKEICRVLVLEGGYCLAWVGQASEGPEKDVIDRAHYGFQRKYLDRINISWNGSPLRTGAHRNGHSHRTHSGLPEYPDRPQVCPLAGDGQAL